MIRALLVVGLLITSFLGSVARAAEEKTLRISGIYPHLASFNGNHECGIGAVVPWAQRLWWITYPPHSRTGSTDKLYSVDANFNLTIHPESVGGTHANRLVHRESKQLLIGPYVIDSSGGIRAFDVKNNLPGRLTATARHLADPANKVYYVDMEGPVWEADVRTLQTRKLFEKPLPGWHGKGAYTAQGLLLVANNGESPALGDLKKRDVTADLTAYTPEDAGVLGAWDGKEWKIIRRRQFTDVTGPGGIYGNEKDSDPLWAMGWDKRSVLLQLLDGGEWHTFRLPKGSHAFDPKHGWFTEWPRIREVGEGKFLMAMHGTLFDFPGTFAAGNTAGIRPRCTHLRYIPDFCDWNGQLVLAADDTSIMQNRLAGQSQSNLWFGTLDDLKKFGQAFGAGGVWLDDAVKAGQPSDPFLFVGYAQRVLHLSHGGDVPVTFTLEVDRTGDGSWQELKKVEVGPRGYVPVMFSTDDVGEWIRLRANRDCQAVSAYFHFGTPAANGDAPKSKADGGNKFQSLAKVDDKSPWCGGLIRPGKYNRNLHFLARTVGEDGQAGPEEFWEVDEKLQFRRVENVPVADEMRGLCRIEPAFTVDGASVIMTNAKSGQRFRLPKGNAAFDKPGELGPRRAVREVVSERSLANIHGTIYEIPRAEGAGKEELNLPRLKPVASHDLQIHDFCTWRGLLVISGCSVNANADGNFFSAGEGKPGLWFGAIDELWQLGKPTGNGGPWHQSVVKANEPSDPYLMTGYDRKRLKLSHETAEPVQFTLEVNFAHNDSWNAYQKWTVPAKQVLEFEFPTGFNAHWVRLTTDSDCTATAQFIYE